MSADNLIRVCKRPDGKYKVTHEFASSLAHALEGKEPMREELLIEVVADNVPTENEAYKLAQDFEQKVIEEGHYVEYGIVNSQWEK